MFLSAMGVMMFISPAAWGLAGLLLAALIVVKRFQTKLVSHSPEGFRSLSGGLSLLALAALARLFHTEGLFAQVPFLSEQIFFDLAYWIGVIAGGSMVVNGASNWLPLARKTTDADRTPSADLLKRIQQLVGVEGRIDVVLTNTLQYMNESVGSSCGAVFKFSRSHARIELAGTTPDFPIARDEMDDLVSACFEGRRLEEKIIDLERCLSECLPSGLCRPSAVIPMDVNGRIVGCFVFWSREGAIEPEDRLSLQLAADIVAHKIDRDQLLAARQADRRRADWFVGLEDAVARAEGTVRKIAALSRGLAEVIPFDALAVTVVPGHGARTIRYSQASGGNVLVEKSVETPLPGALIESAFRSGQTMVYDDLSPERQPDYREIIAHEQVRSMIAVPAAVRGDLGVMLTLVSVRPKAYNRTNQRVLELLRPLIVSTVQADILDTITRREVARFEKLVQVGEAAFDLASAPALVNEIALLTSEEIGADVVRIARLDDSGLFLESMALATPPGRSGSVPADGQMILALMPLHEQAIRSGRLSFGRLRGDTGLTDMEAHQIFGDDIRQAAVMPLVHEGRTVGVITLASETDEPALSGSASSRVFLSLLASTAAALVARDKAGKIESRLTDSVVSKRRVDLPTRARIFGWDDVPEGTEAGAGVFRTPS